MTVQVDSIPYDPVAHHVIKREVAILRSMVNVRKENEIEFFRPHAKQELFFANANYYYRYARTGNRFGKSEMGACEDVAFALGYRPWYPEGHPLRTLGIPNHPTKGLIVCTTWKKSREVFTETEQGALGKLFKYIPKKALVEYSSNHSGFIDRLVVRHISGGYSVIFLDTIEGFKKNPLAQESSVHDWVHIDEPIPEGMFKAISRGLVDRGGRAWFTCTPLTEPWIDKMFIPNIEDMTREEMGVQISSEHKWMMTGSMYDNPHLNPKHIERFLSELTQEERETRLNGVPAAYSGIIYGAYFRYEHHVLRDPPPGWDHWTNPPPDYCIRYAIDYHPKKRDAVLFLATSPGGVTYAYHEIWETMLAEEESRVIKKVLGDHVAQPGLVDPLASTPNKVTDVTQLQKYRQCGLAVLPATKDPDNGIRAVKALLKERDKLGNPTFYVAKHLDRFIFEISRGYVWNKDGTKPEKENDDMMENFYRLALQGLQYIEPPTPSDYTPIQPRDFTGIVDPFEFDDRLPHEKSKFDAKRYRR